MTTYQESPDEITAKAQKIILHSQISELHKKGPELIDWKRMRSLKAPAKPELRADAEMSFREKHAFFFRDVSSEPSGVHGIRKVLLKMRLKNAIRKDQRIYRRELAEYEQEYQAWKAIHDPAEEMCMAHPDYYTNQIKEMGTDFYDGLVPASMDIEVLVRPPDAGERQLIFFVEMTINEEKTGENIDAYSDLEAVLALRTARNLFALFPTDVVFFNFFETQIIRKTGHGKKVYPPSVAFTRDLFLSLNLDKLDPDESMENFEHTIYEDKPLDFEKTLAKILK